MNTMRKVSYGLLLLDALLCSAIIFRVKYTEIDWVAYMQQVEIFLQGERDYTLIKGQTGPLVYPAGHVYIFSAFHWITDRGRDIVTAQVIFAGIYLVTVAVTMGTYRLVKAPIYILPFLILSKRLHSIYILRLFNDGVSSLFMSISTYCYVRDNYILGSLFFSLALSVKMNALLYIPAIALILIQGRGVFVAVKHAFIMLQIQVILGSPFLIHDAPAYLGKAFEFSRVFLYKWTVNWRFIPEHIFLSSQFSSALVAGHVLTLLLFAGTRWNRPSRKTLAQLSLQTIRTTLGFLFPTGNDGPMAKLMPSFILTTLYSSNLIGILFARSAHYQFYSWFAFSMPFLLYKTGLRRPFQLILWVAQEWAWNVFPSTPYSSAVVVLVPFLTLLGVWLNTANEVVAIAIEDADAPKKPKSRRKNKDVR